MEIQFNGQIASVLQDEKVLRTNGKDGYKPVVLVDYIYLQMVKIVHLMLCIFYCNFKGKKNQTKKIKCCNEKHSVMAEFKLV